MKSFQALNLSPELCQSLSHMNYETPTPIQAKAIPLALKGHDIMGTAQTGTGKTAAFAIPLVEKLLHSDYGTALVLTPTRELAKQVQDVVRQLIGYGNPIKSAFIIGGDSMSKQIRQLRDKPRIIVGTPGRVNDHLDRGTMTLHDTSFLVLDETDRMLDMGFSIQIERILEHMPQERQTMMFSATLPPEIQRLSEQFLDEPVRIAIGDTNVVAQNIEQEVIRIHQNDKFDELSSQLNEREGSAVVFVKTKHGADRIAKNLRRDGYEADSLHGDLRQHKRERVMSNFRKKKFRILVATDIAARGLDVPHIEHVINFDLPQVAEDFIHRIGRTARAGAQGSALSFVSPQEGHKWSAIERLLDPDAANDDRGRGRGKPRRFKNRNSGAGKPRRGKDGFKSKGDGYKGKRDDFKSKGDGYKGKRDDFKSKGDGYKGKRDDFKSKGDGYKGKRDDFKSKGDGYKGKRDDFKSKGDGYKGKRDDFKSKGDGYKGNRNSMPRGSAGKPSAHQGRGRFTSRVNNDADQYLRRKKEAA